MTTNPGFVPYQAAVRQKFRELGLWNDDLLSDYLHRWAQDTPDRAAIIVPGEGELSFAQVRERSLRFANALLARGLRKGDVVAIQLPNAPEFLIAYFGLTMMGGILCTLHMPYRAGEMEPLLRFSGARAIICDAANDKYDAPATMQGLVEKIGHLKHVIVAGGAAPEGCWSFDDLIATGATDAIADPPAPEDPVLLCFTSGTSAAPKGVMRSSETIAANGRTYSPTIGMNRDDRVIVAPPFTHVFGLCCVAASIYQGAAIVLMPLFTPESFSHTIAKGRPTVIFCTPAHIALTMRAGLFQGVDLSSIKTVVIAGSVCPPEIAAEFESMMPKGICGQLFGMTECILVTQTAADAPAAVRHGTVGKATDGIETRIADAQNTVLRPGEEGELQLRGYTVLAGYTNNDEANRESFTSDGWFKTGDLGIADADGNIAITGRVKDLINRGGIKINPTDVENLVTAHPSVVQCAIVPMADAELGEKACLFVTLKEAHSFSFDTMVSHLQANNVAKMRWPERLEIVDEMPMTPTKKIQKTILAERLADEPTQSTAPNARPKSSIARVFSFLGGGRD